MYLCTYMCACLYVCLYVCANLCTCSSVCVCASMYLEDWGQMGLFLHVYKYRFEFCVLVVICNDLEWLNLSKYLSKMNVDLDADPKLNQIAYIIYVYTYISICMFMHGYLKSHLIPQGIPNSYKHLLLIEYLWIGD